MSVTSFARTEEANVVLLREQMEREFWHQLFFARFAGFTTVDREGVRQQTSKIPSGAPIEIMRDFADEGSDSLLIPMFKRLTGSGVSGDAQLKGNEESQSIYYQKVYINQKRHATKIGGRMSLQRVKKFNLLQKLNPSLSDWLAQWHEFNFFYTFLHGYSPHIMENTTTGGFYITSGQKICHPNFWCAGDSDFVTWNATAATYEGSVEDGITGLTDTSTDYMSVDLIEEMAVAVKEKKLQPMVTEGGFEFYPWVIHPKQLKQLRKDSDFVNAQKDANIRGMSNPLFTGAAGEYAGFVFYPRMFVPGANPNAGAGTVQFGATNPVSALDTYDRKCSIIFGRQALAHGWALGPYYDEEDEDYKNLRGAAVGVIAGTARADFKDNSTDGSNTAVINQSSIIVATYSA